MIHKAKLLTGIIFSTVLCSCSDWLEPESINDTDLNNTIKTDEYFASLREWKQTPGLPQVFVWFDGWAGTSPTGQNSLRGLPDSVTIASNWGQPKFDLTEAQKADMKYVQEVKGTKVVFTLFAQRIGDNVAHQDIFDTAPNDSNDPEEVRPAIKAYAKALYDACIKEGYDGFDWDYEHSGSGNQDKPLWGNPVHRSVFLEELSFWFGTGAMDPNRDRGNRPMPERRLLLLIDGNVNGISVQGDMADFPMCYVDHYVQQAYGLNSDSGLQSRISGTIRSMDYWIEMGVITREEIVKRSIVTENFESYAGTGGGFLTMARYIHRADGVDQQIGGCGIYRVGFDYDQGKGDYNGSPEYYWLRQGITELYRIYRDRLNVPAEDDGVGNEE